MGHLANICMIGRVATTVGEEAELEDNMKERSRYRKHRLVALRLSRGFFFA